MPKRMPPRSWFNKFTQDEIDQYSGKTKVCPRCLESKEIVEHFGLKSSRYWYDPPESKRRRTTANTYCFPCSSRNSAERAKRNRPEKIAADLARLRELDKTPAMRAKKAAFQKEWRKRTHANSEYHRRHVKKYPLRHLARLMARFAYPEPQICSVAGCDKIGMRHHADYSKPLEITWLCKTHHADEHRRLRDEQLKSTSNTNVK